MDSITTLPIPIHPSALRRSSLGAIGTTFGMAPLFGYSYPHSTAMNKMAACCSQNKYWLESGPHSRGEPSSLELEAIAAVQQLSLAVQTISVSEMLPRTAELIFVNVTTVDGQPYCLELTAKGWRVTSLRSDCMQGDFTRMDLFTKYFVSVFDLMEHVSPGYKQILNENLAQRLRLLEDNEDDYVDNVNDEGGAESTHSSPIQEVRVPSHLSSSGNSSDTANSLN